MQKDGQIETEEKHGLEKKKIERMHKDQLQSRDRTIMFVVFMYFGLVVIMFDVVDKK